MKWNLVAALVASFTPTVIAQSPCLVADEKKLSATVGGLDLGVLDDNHFGYSIALMADASCEKGWRIAVGAPGDDEAGVQGTVYILCVSENGLVTSQKVISRADVPSGVPMASDAAFGRSVAWLGNLGAGAPTERALAVSANQDEDPGGLSEGAVFILFLNDDESVNSATRISSAHGGLVGPLDDIDSFGYSLSSIGDFNGDERIDLAVGALDDDDGGIDRGAVYLLTLNANGTSDPAFERKISSTVGGLTGPLADHDRFGTSVAFIGDVDGDGVADLAVGALNDDDGGLAAGAVHVLLLTPLGAVKAEQKISATDGGFGGDLDAMDAFSHVGAIGDIDADGVPDLLIGAHLDDDGGPDRGAVYVVPLTSDGSARADHKISQLEGGFGGMLDNGGRLGIGLARLDPTEAGGPIRFCMGAFSDDDGGVNRGSMWIVALEASASQVSRLGTPANVDCLKPGPSGPIVGSCWYPYIDHSTFMPNATFDVLALSLGSFNLLLGDWGTLLGDPNLVVLNVTSPGVGLPFPLCIPPECALIGIPLFTQGVSIDLLTVGVGLTNALDIVLGAY